MLELFADPNLLENACYSTVKLNRTDMQADGSEKTLDSNGSGWIVGVPSKSQPGLYAVLVTVNHCIWASLSDTKYAQLKPVELRINGWREKDLTPVQATVDLASELATTPKPSNDGVFALLLDGKGDVASMRKFPYKHLKTETQLQTERTVGRTAMVAGYPTVAGIDTDMPLVSVGTLASSAKRPLQVNGADALLYQADSWNGMSGGPLFVDQVGMPPTKWIEVSGYQSWGIAGVSAGHVTTQGQHTGWSYAFPSSAVRIAVADALCHHVADTDLDEHVPISAIK